MKDFSQVHGQLYRMSYDPISGEFMNVVAPLHITQTVLTVPLESKVPENFKPKLVSRSEFQKPSTPAKTLHKKRA